MGRLDGKVAVVTGGSRGIGAAIARRLGAEGAAVVVNYARSGEAAKSVAEAIRAAGGRAEAVQADVSDREQVAALFEAARERFGRVDVLVNNAGVIAPASLEQIDEKGLDLQFGVNVGGVVWASQEAARSFNGDGRIVNVSSIVASDPLPGIGIYAATKAAVDALTRSLAAELGPRRITVNAVSPGPIETDMFESVRSEDFDQAVRTRTPLGGVGAAEDVAAAVAFLASDEARWITGTVVRVDGGFRP